MTLLNRRLRRETDTLSDFDRHSRGRPIIIELEPSERTIPAQIGFRFKGTRRKYSAPVSWLAQKTIEMEVARNKRERKKGKKREMHATI